MLKKIGLALLVIVLLVLALAATIAARHLVYWAPTEEVSFASGEVRLAGTLVKPAREGVYPGIVMLHGSGPEPRMDPPSRAVVNVLVRNGFAVLFYDKRGVGASGGDFESASYRDFIDDGIAAVRYLADRPDVDGETIGLQVVSESGWFAPEIADRTGLVDFIFNKVGPPMSVLDTVAWEIRNDFLAEGINASDVDALVGATLRRWRYYLATADDPELATDPERDEINREMDRLRREIPQAEEVLPEEVQPYDPAFYRSFAANTGYDPTPFLRRLDIPMYYAFGGIDVNIPTEECVAVLESLIRNHGKDIEYTVYPDVGHSLATWRGLLDVGFVPGYLDALDDWTSRQLDAQKSTGAEASRRVGSTGTARAIEL